MWPRKAGRDSPITGVVLTGGDVDAIAGLLVLRERQPFTIYAPGALLDVLAGNDVSMCSIRRWCSEWRSGHSSRYRAAADLTLTLLPMPGKVPLYRGDAGATEPEAGPNYAAMIRRAAAT